MSDADILLTLVPTNPDYPETPAHLVGVIRNILELSKRETAVCKIRGVKHGLIIRGQKGGNAFEWSIDDDGRTYLKAWGMEPTKTWPHLEEGFTKNGKRRGKYDK